MDNFNSTNGTNSNPLEMDVYNFSFHCVCCLIGLPLNFYIVIRIIGQKLYEKPRNILLLAMVICNILTLLMSIDDIVYFFYPNESLCRLFVTVIELPYILFFFNLLLSLIDRFVAMVKPMWHHQNVTVPLVIFWIVVLNAALALALNWVYISGMAELKCQIQTSHATTADSVLLVLCVSCIIFTIVDYVETRTLLPSTPSRQSSRSSTITVPPSTNRSGSIEMANVNPFAPPPPVAAGESSTMGVHMNIATLQRMETEATKTLMAGITALILLPCPLLVFTFSHLICMFLYPEGNQCNNIIWLAPYFKELVTLHALVHPIIIVLRNKQFMSPSRQPVATAAAADHHPA